MWSVYVVMHEVETYDLSYLVRLPESISSHVVSVCRHAWLETRICIFHLIFFSVLLMIDFHIIFFLSCYACIG